MGSRLLISIVAIAASLVAALSPANSSHAQTPAACPTDATISLAPPSASAPTTVVATVTPDTLNIQPASDADPESFHVHYFIDTEATPAGTPIPTGQANIIHSASLTQDLGTLSAGSHTVTVVLGQVDHTACEARASVTFDVTDGETTGEVTPPQSGNAGLSGSAGAASAWATVLLGGVALAGVVGGRIITGRARRGARP